MPCSSRWRFMTLIELRSMRGASSIFGTDVMTGASGLCADATGSEPR